MPNIGHTLIKATGTPQHLAALAAHVRSTARGGSAFTLSGLMRAEPAPDPAVRWADLTATDTMVSLSIALTYDRDALGVAARIAEDFPALRIVALFAAECDETAFDALGFAAGKLAYQAHFDDDLCFAVPAPGPDGDERRAALVRLFRRTPDRSAAALDHLDPAPLARLADQPAAAGGWREVAGDGAEVRAWWHPGAADDAGQVLVARDGAFALLTGVDCRGGYAHEEQLEAEAVTRRLPALAVGVARYRREHAAETEQRQREHAADHIAHEHVQACPNDQDGIDIPF